MSQYFDKDFFRLLSRFIIIIIASCLIILGTRMYEVHNRSVDPETQTATSNN